MQSNFAFGLCSVFAGFVAIILASMALASPNCASQFTEATAAGIMVHKGTVYHIIRQEKSGERR